MNSEITLVEAIFGMGNATHQHVHRHNMLALNSIDATQMMTEKHLGGVSLQTMNAVAERSGSISAQHQGMVNIEDGWNLRRGLGMLRFVVSANSLATNELTVLGYLFGGSVSDQGITADVMFVPVRSWTVNTRNVMDGSGLPTTTRAICGSDQFLMNDCEGQRNLTTMRPLDVVEGVLGMTALMEDSNTSYEEAAKRYGGTIGNDLRHNVVLSNTRNLNPSNYAKSLLRAAVGAGGMDGELNGISESLADNFNSVSMGESNVFDNPFFNTMRSMVGMHNYAGFNGFSIGEIAGVFNNFGEVANVNMMNTNNYGAVDHILTSNEHGSANYQELLATEMAYLTVHNLIECGLTACQFSATNDVGVTGGIANQSGVAWAIGEASSVISQDNGLANRVESFKQRIERDFFSKYNGVYDFQRVTVNIAVSAFIFGETSVNIHLDDNVNGQRSYVNASYCVNRHSTNLATNDITRQQTKNLYTNITNDFSNVGL